MSKRFIILWYNLVNRSIIHGSSGYDGKLSLRLFYCLLVSYSIFDFIVVFILLFLFVRLFTFKLWTWVLVLLCSVSWLFKNITLQAGHSILNERYAFSCSMCDWQRFLSHAQCLSLLLLYYSCLLLIHLLSSMIFNSSFIQVSFSIIFLKQWFIFF